MANWTPLGPSVQANSDATGHPPVSGRVTAIAVGPGGTRAYVSTQNGGVWSTADAGLTWAPLLDAETMSPTSGLDSDVQWVWDMAVLFSATDPTKDVIVALTAAGVRISTQSGAAGTWQAEATNVAGASGWRVLIDPAYTTDPSLVFIATSFGLYRRSLTTPASWSFIALPATTRATDVAVAGSGAGKKYYAACPGNSIYSSANLSTWNPVSGSSLAGANRVVLAVAESNPAVVYSLGDDARLLQLSGTAFQQITSVPAGALFPGGQGQGDIILAVDPSNANTVYLGGDRTNGVEAALFKGTIAGTTFPFNQANAGNPAADSTWIGQGVHADVHSFGFALNGTATAHDAGNVWVGTDGGLWHSTASGAKGTFAARNTGLATLFVNQMAQRADTASTVLAAGQDNGTFRMFAEEAGMQIFGGDGEGVAVDPNNGYRIMIAGEVNNLLSSPDTGTSWFLGNFPPRGDSNEITIGPKLYTSPPGVTPTVLCAGTNRVWMTTTWGDNTNVANPWTTLPTNSNPYVPPATNKYTQDQLDGPVMSMQVVSASLIFACTAKTVYRFDLSGTTWTRTAINMANLPANRWVISLAVDNATTGSFYVTLVAGATASSARVWYCAGSGANNGGAGFVVALPQAQLDCSVRASVVDPANPANVYIGTDVGVWQGTKTGATTWTWAPFGAGLPQVEIGDLMIHSRARLLRAALNGRGLWEIPLGTAIATPDYDIYLRVNYADDGHISGGARFPWVDGAQDPTSPGWNVYHWMSADIKVWRPSLNKPALPAQPTYLDFAFNVNDYLDSTSHIETADNTGSNKLYVEVHNRGRLPLAAQQVRVCLLVTTVSTVLPPLPGGFANAIRTGDTSNWVQGSSWFFASPGNIYRLTQGVLDARTPQVVEFDVNFSQLGLPAGDHVCAAAFITTVGTQDQLPQTLPTSLDQLTMQDKHVAHRNLHLVAPGATPFRAGLWHIEKATILVDLHAVEGVEESDVVFDRRRFAGTVSVMLPRHLQEKATRDWEVVNAEQREHPLREHLEHVSGVLERVHTAAAESHGNGHAADGGSARVAEVRALRRERIAEVDRSRLFVAGEGMPTLTGVHIHPDRPATMAITVQPPADAKPGDRYRIDVMQRSGDRILGGSTIVIGVVEARPHAGGNGRRQIVEHLPAGGVPVASRELEPPGEQRPGPV